LPICLLESKPPIATFQMIKQVIILAPLLPTKKTPKAKSFLYLKIRCDLSRYIRLKYVHTAYVWPKRDLFQTKLDACMTMRPLDILVETIITKLFLVPCSFTIMQLAAGWPNYLNMPIIEISKITWRRRLSAQSWLS
jgi:hypothetical protein